MSETRDNMAQIIVNKFETVFLIFDEILVLTTMKFINFLKYTMGAMNFERLKNSEISQRTFGK